MLGVFFFQLPLGGSTRMQSFMLASKTERFWWICVICRSTTGEGAMNAPRGAVCMHPAAMGGDHPHHPHPLHPPLPEDKTNAVKH